MKSTHLVELKKFELIEDLSQEISFGLNQEWYLTKWQRLSGCGPTAASSLIYYTFSNDLSLNKLAAIKLMEDVWTYVTPGMGGVYKRSMFTSGLQRYFETNKISSNISSIEITKSKKTRLSLVETITFIETGLNLNSPIAFLNLDNGDEKKLDEWHWVVVSGIDIHEAHSQVFIHIIDDGKLFAIDLELWLRTTKKGGAFVYFTMD
jgi:hypothetical protein